MSKKQKTYAVRSKRSKPQGVDGKPTMVATFKKKAMFNPEVNNILESLEKEAAKFDPKNNPVHAEMQNQYWLGADNHLVQRQAMADLAAPHHRKAVRKAMDAPTPKPTAKQRLRYGAGGALHGAAIGGLLGSMAGLNLEGMKGAGIGAGIGAGVLGTAAAVHGGKDSRRFEQVLKAQGLSKKACLNPEIENILEDLEEMHKEAFAAFGKNSREAYMGRRRARKRVGLDAAKKTRRNARVMGAMAKAEEAGRSFTNKTKPTGYKSDYMKQKHAPTFMGSAKKMLKTPGGAAIGAGLAGAAIGAATAKPKTVTTTAPDGTRTATTTKPNRLSSALKLGAGASLAAGGASLALRKTASAETNNILSLLEKEARAKKPQVLPKAGWNMVAPLMSNPNKRPGMSPRTRKAAMGAGIGAAAGAIRGAVKNPGTNEDGTKKSRLKAIAKNTAGGAAIGGAAGAGVGAANNRGYSVGFKPKS